MMEVGLIMGLRAAWIAAILPILIASLPSSKLSEFHNLVTGFAKRGKTIESSSAKFTLPQRYFFHFYVLALVWTTLLLVATWHYAYTTAPLVSEPYQFPSIARQLTGGSHSFSLHRSHSMTKEDTHRISLSVFLLVLMEIQVLRRLFETVYVFKYSPSARMHIFGYLVGLFFYTAAPLSLCCTCVSDVFKVALDFVEEFIVKGKDQIQFAESDWRGMLTPLVTVKWYAWLGAAIFSWGWIHQRHCHAILGSLRENQENTELYVVPHGDWFEYVSCPHYLAEIVIYAGLLLASGCSDLTLWLLFGFVVANLVFAASDTHRWYRQKFDDYPRERFAVIPFVF